MPTAKAGYYYNDIRLPSVTTILGRFKESGSLVRWAYNVGLSGKDLYGEKDKAATIGTIAHAMVDAHLHGVVLDLNPHPIELVKKAEISFGAFLNWAAHTGLNSVATEQSLVSKEHLYGGTLDAVLEVNRQLALVEWKSSNSIYVDFLLQMAAYKVLWEENHPDMLLTGGYHLLRFDKESGDFHHHCYNLLDDAKEMFLCLRRAFDFDKLLKKRVK